MRGRRGEIDYADDYTPATDLVFSLFAMTILLLAITGAGGKIRDHNRQLQIGLLTNKVTMQATVIASRLPVQCDKDTGVGKPEPLQCPPQAAPIPLLTPVPSPSAPEDDVATVKALRLGDLAAPASGSFTVQQGVFAPETLARILAMLVKYRNGIEAYQANEIVFQISTRAGAGLEASGTGDSDLLLTMRWGEALIRALWKKSLPMGCVILEPIGSARAVDMIERAIKPDSGKILAALNAARQTPYVNQDSNTIQARTADDTRIAVWLRKDPASRCTAQNLIIALSKVKP